MDPHSFGCLESGSVSRMGIPIPIPIQKHGNGKSLQINLVTFVGMIFYLLHTLIIFFNVKIPLFVTLKSDQDRGQDPDPHG